MAYNPPNPNGQATKANSQPVVLPSDIDTLPVADTGLGTDGSSPPSITGTGVRGWLRAIYEKVNVAATAAKQPALGTAGSASTDVLSVQGIASGIPLPASQSVAIIPAATTMQNAANANGNGTSLGVNGYATAILNIVSSTPMSGGTTVNFEASVDDSTWVSIVGQKVGSQGISGSTTTTDGDFRFLNIAGYKSIRARISGYSAGVTTIKGYVSPLSAAPTSVLITDGTQAANTIAGDSGQNSVVVAGTRKEVSFSTTTAQAVGLTDCSNYRYVSVHIVSQGTSSNITFQQSNDGTNWVSVVLVSASSTGSSGSLASSSNSASAIWHGAVSARYFRLNVSGISAGTTAGVIEFFAVPGMFGTTNVQAQQNGTWTVQPGNTANTTAWLTTDRGSGGTTSQPATSTSVATLLASNASRKQAVIVNDSSSVLYVKLGSTATATDFSYKLVAGATLIEDKYTGIITGLLDTSSGTARVTEVA